jgi:Uma2 family endonuclease
MAVKQAEKLYTVDDYLARPDEYPRYELLEGELIEMVSPTSRHQRISRQLFTALNTHCAAHDLGEVFYAPLDVILSRTVVVQPDLLFISKARQAELIGERITGAPDLVIEILSPATSARDFNQKRKLYARHGVKEYWIVDPDDGTIEVQRLQGTVFSTLALFEKGQTLTSPTFEGLEMHVGQVFAE